MKNRFRIIKFALLLTFESIISANASNNRAPYFIPGTGDFSTFSIPENFQVGTSVYKLKGETSLFSALSNKTHFDLTQKAKKKSHINYFASHTRAAADVTKHEE